MSARSTAARQANETLAERGLHATPAAVSKTCLIRFDNNRYSVEARAVGRPVEIRAYADRIECWPLSAMQASLAGQREGEVVGRHARVYGRGGTVYDPLHYIPVLARKPGALRNGAPFKEWELPPAIRRVQRKLEKQPRGDRQPNGECSIRLSASGSWTSSAPFSPTGSTLWTPPAPRLWSTAFIRRAWC